MTPETYKALEDSITHWKRVVADPLGESTGSKACALCQVAIDCGCQACPIMQRTGGSSCTETPFIEFQAAKAVILGIYRGTLIKGEELDRLSKLAEKELQFLISLRESGADELIRRLRISRHFGHVEDERGEAADCIETQQTEIKRLKVQLESNGEEKLYHDEVTKLYSWLDLASTDPLYYAHFHSELYARKALALSKLLNSSQSKLKED